MEIQRPGSSSASSKLLLPELYSTTPQTASTELYCHDTTPSSAPTLTQQARVLLKPVWSSRNTVTRDGRFSPATTTTTAPWPISCRPTTLGRELHPQKTKHETQNLNSMELSPELGGQGRGILYLSKTIGCCQATKHLKHSPNQKIYNLTAKLRLSIPT